MEGGLGDLALHSSLSFPGNAGKAYVKATLYVLSSSYILKLFLDLSMLSQICFDYGTI